MKNDQPDPKPGLEPLELIALNQKKRKVVGWLTRNQQSTLLELEDALNLNQEDLVILLDQLLEENQIIRADRDGDFVYSAPLQGKVSRKLKGFPEDLWKKAGLDD